MGSVRTRKETGLLFLDFRYKGRRSREQTSLPDTAENRKCLAKALRRIEQQIADGTFDYRSTFPAPHCFSHCATCSPPSSSSPSAC